MHCLYFIYAQKIYVRTHVKIAQQWKSTFVSYNLRAYARNAWKVVLIRVAFRASTIVSYLRT